MRPRPGARLAAPYQGIGQFRGNDRPGAPEAAACAEFLDGMLAIGDGGSRVALTTSHRGYTAGDIAPQLFLTPVASNDTSDSGRLTGNTTPVLNRRRAGAR